MNDHDGEFAFHLQRIAERGHEIIDDRYTADHGKLIKALQCIEETIGDKKLRNKLSAILGSNAC